MIHVIQRHQDFAVVRLPIRTQSETNMREHWTKRHRRRAGQRTPTALAMAVIGREYELPVVVRLTRIAPRQLDDDNLRGALKAVRDGVADAFGVDDGDKRFAWQYDQRRGGVGEYAVEIAVCRAEDARRTADDLPEGCTGSGE
jgi:hypothetical protein